MLMKDKLLVIEDIVLAPEFPDNLTPKMWNDIRDAVDEDDLQFFVRLLKSNCKKTKVGILRRITKRL